MTVEKLVPESGNLKNFIDQFLNYAQAPNGVVKLRGLILELAMRGRLVVQDEKEQSAYELLEVIKSSKAIMIKECRIKKVKPLLSVNNEEIPYHIPNEWVWCRFGEIGVITSSSRVHKKDWRNDGVPFYRAREIVKLSKYGSVENDLFISEKLFKNLSEKGVIPEPNDLMITGVGTIGTPYVVQLKEKFYFKDASVLIFKNYFNLYTPFLYYFLKSPGWLSAIHSKSMGTTVHTLTIARSNEALIPLPPLEEQKRIVAKVNELMALCDKLEAQQQKQANNVLRANTAAITALLSSDNQTTTSKPQTKTFEQNWQRIAQNFNTLYGCTLPMPPGEGRQKKYLVGLENVKSLRSAITTLAVEGKLSTHSQSAVDIDGIKKNCSELRDSYIEKKWMRKQKNVELDNSKIQHKYPTHWPVALFDDVAVVIGGLTKGRNLKGKVVESFPYLRVANVQRGFFNLEVMKEILIPVEEFGKYKILPGDLLITEGGDWDKVGRTAIWSGQLENCLHQNHVFKARVGSKLLMNRWVEIVFNSGVGRDYFSGASKQTTNLASINMTQLRGFPLPIPPIDEQKNIISRVDELMSLCDQLEKQHITAYDESEKLMEATVKALVA